MRVAYIVPGSGGTFYCQNCLRDNALVQSARAAGHDVILVPMYLPMFTDIPGQAGTSPIFYGAVNLYLNYRLPLLKRMPACFRRLLDSKSLLSWAARRADSTSARGLERMTIAMLRGESGPMSSELDELLNWMADQARPDVVHISNALLLGLVAEIKRRLQAPVVCSLQDEEQWVDAMDEPFRGRIWDLMAERGRQVDMFAAVSSYYADVIRDRMKVPADRMTVVNIGIDMADYDAALPLPRSSMADHPPAIGYLSKISESLGFSILTEAFIELKQDSRLQNLQLKATGGLVGADIRYVRHIRRRMQTLGYEQDFNVQPQFDRGARIAFLRNLTLLSVPVPGGESFGMHLIESMAAGVPVVQPRVGYFPQLIDQTGGGVVYEPNTPSALAAAMKPLLLDPARAADLGAQGRRSVAREFSLDRMTNQMINLWKSVT